MRVRRPWHRLPREDETAPFLEASQARLDSTWSSLGFWKCPSQGGGLEQHKF